MRNRISQLIKNFTATQAGLFFSGVGAGIVLYGFFLTADVHNWNKFISEVYSNFGIELISIGLTVVVIERLNRRAAEKERLQELILQMGSTDNGFALEAVRLLNHRGAFNDSSLKAGKLAGANLKEAYLEHTKLQGVDLRGANLQDAHLGGAKLQMANLGSANLQGAKLQYVDLQEAILEYVNLKEVNLVGANLQGANLVGANLQGAYLGSSVFNKNTFLPDLSQWTPETDMMRFTDPNHPNFWKPPSGSSS